MNFIDIVRDVTSGSHHKYDSVNKIKVKIMEMAKLDEHEYKCDYNYIHKDVINALREEGFTISLNSGWHKIYCTIRW